MNTSEAFETANSRINRAISNIKKLQGFNQPTKESLALAKDTRAALTEATKALMTLENDVDLYTRRAASRAVNDLATLSGIITTDSGELAVSWLTEIRTRREFKTCLNFKQNETA